jgi:2-oxoisovalerate dehydrogenase E1 component alpha subunit
LLIRIKFEDYLDGKMEKDTLLAIYENMVKSRVLEERLINMFKQNQGFFWIGGPGEEAFNVPLGMQIKKGQGIDYDYLHFHYRSSAILVAMGMDPASAIRQMKNTAADPHSGGRNFSSHYSLRRWNVTPITSPIEVQYVTAIGTAIAQKQQNAQGITIVNGGDAGTAEGDFASCLVWSSRPNYELPILIIVTNNEWGISTHASTQHGEKNIADRGKAFGIKTQVVNGNDVIESYQAIAKAMRYVRQERRPFLLEAKVSRLYGHSSASGAMFQTHEADPLTVFEQQLCAENLLTAEKITTIRNRYAEEYRLLADKIKDEPQPDPASIYDYTYWQQQGKTW